MNRKNLFSKVLFLSVFSSFLAGPSLGKPVGTEDKKSVSSDDKDQQTSEDPKKSEQEEEKTKESLKAIQDYLDANAKFLDENGDKDGAAAESRKQNALATKYIEKLEKNPSLTGDQRLELQEMKSKLASQKNDAIIKDNQNFLKRTNKFVDDNKANSAAVIDATAQMAIAAAQLKFYQIGDAGKALSERQKNDISKTHEGIVNQLNTAKAPLSLEWDDGKTPSPNNTVSKRTPVLGSPSGSAASKQSYVAIAVGGGNLTFKPRDELALGLVRSATQSGTVSKKKSPVSIPQSKNGYAKARGVGSNLQTALTSPPRIDYGFLDELPSQKKLPQAALVLHNRQPASSVSLPLGEGGGHKQR